MANPYQVLGVSENDSDEQIKNVYRDLCKKYHPDLRPEGISKEQAESKMAEINAAYDEIMLMRKRGASHQGGGYSGGYSQSQFADVRRLINERRIAQAEEILDGVPADKRNAEWYFLKGTIYYSRGWLNEAFTHLETAVRLDPNNREYAEAYQRLFQRRSGNYNAGGYRTGDSAGGCDSCDLCTLMCCANSCCECMGGRGCC